MSSNISINKEIEEYINNHSLKLNSVQKEIILYNEGLGKIKRMQIAVSQCHFLHLIIKISKIKKILEIGTFTGLSTLSMSLALPKDGRLIALDKNQETNKIALNFFKKAKQDSKIQTIIRPALESLKIFHNPNHKLMNQNVGSNNSLDLNIIYNIRMYHLNYNYNLNFSQQSTV